MTANADIEALSAHFRRAVAVFDGSPLYQVLCPVVAEDRPLLELLTRRRSGQQASFLLFGAVHQLLLDGADHRLRDYYPSLVPDPPSDLAGAERAFADFCREYRAPLEELIRTRLVQSNVVRRAVGLRYALWAIGQRCPGPVHLIEVGASAGLLLNVDRYRYRIGDREFGRPDSSVVLDSQWRGPSTVPDLDDVPKIARKVGIDLHPVDVADSRQQQWLRALVWPEQHAAAALLEAAVEEARAEPPTVLAGDALEVCPAMGRELPAGEPRAVFHAATRMHVPVDRREEFDAAIDSIGATGPLFHAWIEPPDAPHSGYPVGVPDVLAMHGPGDTVATSVARVDGHLRWLEPLR